jgi:hypothetical protein
MKGYAKSGVRKRRFERLVPDACFTSNWWPETIKLYNMLQSEMMRTGTRITDCQLVYYSLTDTRLWTSEHVFKKSKFRFWLEVALVWIKIYSRLSKADSRKDFLAGFGIEPEEVKGLVWKDMTRKEGFPKIAERFNKTIHKEDNLI